MRVKVNFRDQNNIMPTYQPSLNMATNLQVREDVEGDGGMPSIAEAYAR